MKRPGHQAGLQEASARERRQNTEESERCLVDSSWLGGGGVG